MADERRFDPSWCRGLRNESVKRQRGGRTRLTAKERFDDWEWAEEKNLCPSLKPRNVEMIYTDAIGAKTSRLVTVEAVIEKGDGLYIKGWCHERNAERTFRVREVGEIVDLETGEVHSNANAWLAALSF